MGKDFVWFILKACFRNALINVRQSTSLSFWFITLSAAIILAITQGARQTTGMYVSPMNTDTGLGIANIAFAMAVGQFVWGVVQPIAGALAGRLGYAPMLTVGVLLMILGSVITPMMTTTLGLVIALGVIQAAGAGIGSFSLLMGAVANRIPADKRPFASGVVNAGSSLGQFIFAPITAGLIAWVGWVKSLWSVAAIALIALPLVWILRAPSQGGSTAVVEGPSLNEQLKIAVRDKSYWLLHAGFFTCGFHIAFLVTHLPTEIQLCDLSPKVSGDALAIIGLFNIAGSLLIGWMATRWRMRALLAGLYACRAIAIGLYLLAPKTPETLYLFSAVIGLTWLATVPPTAGLVSKLFGVKHLATLFGLTLLSHQIGGFLGAWLGGIAIDATGTYHWMWYADMALALLAAAASLPVREAAPKLAAAAA
ncbi:MAG: MFS transporter [Betaproteobacteria bacterium]|nr:MFS transporter [Betaproteobacteria bacterium]NBP37301.1 MFS transporter [Betaproteobacteria bacterium]NBQ77692.1 MFS transporter [Betaproteobacteria bacterium]NBQ94882.1 MFS transporter [Betaproteobacteria bacterium]NBS38419.1 MFS transporter [Betaproteobacteria bacterium]